jgi:ATP-dependent RNA helicase DDX60
MSFVPAPQQANAARNHGGSSGVTTTSVAPASGGLNLNVVSDADNDSDIQFKLRTFDVYWIEKNALMYKDGITKVSNASGTCVSLLAILPYTASHCLDL